MEKEENEQMIILYGIIVHIFLIMLSFISQ